jgi:hypothetical protein
VACARAGAAGFIDRDAGEAVLRDGRRHFMSRFMSCGPAAGLPDDIAGSVQRGAHRPPLEPAHGGSESADFEFHRWRRWGPAFWRHRCDDGGVKQRGC